MKHFYDFHYSKEINNLIEYSLDFNGYVNNIIGIRYNIKTKNINKTKYTNKNISKLTKLYHPTLSNK
jgi:hypothetical protein